MVPLDSFKNLVTASLFCSQYDDLNCYFSEAFETLRVVQLV
jgi:hypothetical protein